MNVLIDIAHSAHVHLFRNLYYELEAKKHNLFLTVKDNLSTAKELLAFYKIPFMSIGQKYDSLISKALMQLTYDYKVAVLARKNNIALGVGTSINLAHASKITRMKSIVLDDDDDAVEPLFVKFVHPFSDSLLSPVALSNTRRKKDTIYYPGTHELAYLHPNRFSPDKNVLSEAGLEKGERYFVLRFNSFKAHHDVGIHGLSLENKRKLISLLKPHGKIFITTEREIDEEFKEYQIKIATHEIHSFLHYATAFFGDSQTMTSEAAVLGTPALKCNSFAGRLAVPNELEEKYQLCYSYLPENFDTFLQKAQSLLEHKDIKQEWQRKRARLLNEKIDVTSFLLWFVENYPNSTAEVKENPHIYKNFQ